MSLHIELSIDDVRDNVRLRCARRLRTPGGRAILLLQ
jgi:hypothetical protein